MSESNLDPMMVLARDWLNCRMKIGLDVHSLYQLLVEVDREAEDRGYSQGYTDGWNSGVAEEATSEFVAAVEDEQEGAERDAHGVE